MNFPCLLALTGMHWKPPLTAWQCQSTGAPQPEAVQLPQLVGKALEAAGSRPGSTATAARVWGMQARFCSAMHRPIEQHAALLKQVNRPLTLYPIIYPIPYTPQSQVSR